MRRVRNLIALLIAGILVIFIQLKAYSIWDSIQFYHNTAILECMNQFDYDQDIEKKLSTIKESKCSLLLWGEVQKATITNQDYSRSTEADAMPVAGDTSLMFGSGNSLHLLEHGSCILGSETAQKLFGTLQVNGRTVRIGKKNYTVAGIEYRIKSMCAFEIAPDDQLSIRNLMFSYESSRDKIEKDQMIKNLLEQEFTDMHQQYVKKHLLDY